MVKKTVQKISLEQWLDIVKSGHEEAAKAMIPAADGAGCCTVQNPQTGGVYQIPTDAATCTAIGGTFSPGPC